MYHQDFPLGSQRREALLFRVISFIKTRAGSAQELDTALFRLAISTAKFGDDTDILCYHRVDCWHVAYSLQCTCVEASMRNLGLLAYQDVLANSALFQRARSQLETNQQVNIAKDSLYSLECVLSLSGQRASELLPFIPV